MTKAIEDIEPTELTYYLKCKILVKEIWVEDVSRSGMINIKRTMCYLLPELNTQGVRFLKAWLPDTEEDANGNLAYFELVSFLGGVVVGPCRLAIGRKNKNCPEGHHLYVMTKGVEEEIVEYNLNGKNIEVEIQPESGEQTAVQGKDSSKDITPYDL